MVVSRVRVGGSYEPLLGVRILFATLVRLDQENTVVLGKKCPEHTAENDKRSVEETSYLPSRIVVEVLVAYTYSNKPF